MQRNFIDTIFRRLHLFAAIILMLSSCNLALVAPYDQELAKQIDVTAKEIDRFYLNMLEKTTAGNGGRAYPQFRDTYLDIEVELNALYTRNRIKPLNKYSTRNCEIALNRWIGFREEHKNENTISDGLIKYNRKFMNDIFYTIRIAEDAKQ